MKRGKERVIKKRVKRDKEQGEEREKIRKDEEENKSMERDTKE